jgi:hypothetical protein
VVELAVLEAVQLALMGLRGVDDNPGSFNRYFYEEDKCTVRSVFSRLLRDPSLQIDPKPAAPDFQRYRICNGDGRVGFDDISGNPVLVRHSAFSRSLPPDIDPLHKIHNHSEGT